MKLELAALRQKASRGALPLLWQIRATGLSD